MDYYSLDFPDGSAGKESACNAGDVGSIPGSGVFPGEGNGNPFPYSCLGNFTDRRPGGLQSMESQKSQTGLNNLATTTGVLGLRCCSLAYMPHFRDGGIGGSWGRQEI